MAIKDYPEFLKLLNTSLMDADQDQDVKTARQHAERISTEARDRLVSQIQALLASGTMPLEEIGTESNRWFGSDDEARSWLQSLAEGIGSSVGGADSEQVVKDSNGTRLLEGDSVTVIKDLKVKGGSSDLKRGTLVKKIHLTSDPDLIECRVEGSTLVLRTEFLKKS